MILAYIVAVLISLAVYAVMGGVDMRLRIGVSLCLLICLVALATWLVARVGDEARPGSVEVPSAVPDREPPASGAKPTLPLNKNSSPNPPSGGGR